MHIKLFAGKKAEEKPSSVGDRLEMARLYARMSQGDFCEQFGMSRTSLQNYVRGKRDLPLEVAKRVIVELELDSEWFLFGNHGRPDNQSK